MYHLSGLLKPDLPHSVETKFAIDCWKRKTALERKFRRIRTNAGKVRVCCYVQNCIGSSAFNALRFLVQRKAPDDQAYVLAQAVLEADRAELAALNVEYKTARAELDRVEREKKAAAAAAAPPPPPPAPAPKPTPAKPAAPRMPYYPPSSSTAATTSIFPQTPTSYTAQYKNYAYPYSQAYSSAYTAYTPPAFPSTPTTRKAPPMSRTPTTVPVLQLAPPSVQVPSASPRPPAAASPAASSPAAASPVQVTGSAAAASTSAPPPNVAPIPVHLPVSSLTSLSALGIVPVPAANAPPAGQAQPACVLRGTSQNGTMVSLDINVSALGQAQASGLAVLLSALTSRPGAGAPAPAASAGGPGGVGGTEGDSSSQTSAGGAVAPSGAG